jgi:hypothetical protein
MIAHSGMMYEKKRRLKIRVAFEAGFPTMGETRIETRLRWGWAETLNETRLK